ncbi:Rap1a/Tai family immunity protein [Agrobacterium sp. NPDC089420]|uniref:Rap1a/Tai family immunity protein n=1 Tax=Agrobacterium sp. NPDC089420 TaxID=3363918 RepID=UPI0038511B4E
MRSLYVFFVSVPFVVALSGASSAGAQERTWIFSGAELKQAIEGKLAPEVSDPEMRRLVSVAKSSAYIAGVADLTSGADWCGAGAVPPHELTDRIYTYLGDLPVEKLDERAANLVREALKVSFPCEPKSN